MRARGEGVRLVLAIAAAATVTLAYARSGPQPAQSVPAQSSLTTQERMYASAWWPTKGDPAAKEYAGEATCAKCHAEIATLQHTTPMYRAATPASRLSARTPLSFGEGGYTYSIAKTAAGMDYIATAAGVSDARPIAWAFGDSVTGQTYLLSKGSGYIESRLSYYTAPNSLDITVGHSAQPPANLHDAFGHELSFDTAQRCFSCHTTASTVAGEFMPEKSVPGVTCEACHGPGAAHIAAASAEQRHQTIASVTNPASMFPADSVDFCGSCHRTFSDVAVYMPANLGATAIRFQPYQLEKSRCWGQSGDARITCIACHDPHKPLEKDAASYDRRCVACHRSGVSPPTGPPAGPQLPAASNQTAPACKIASSKCVTCHMPKFEVPQTHAAFTDHEIRVVRAASVSAR